MTDDWSLTELKTERIYIQKEIDTLREKLIEDVKELYKQEEPRTFNNYQEYFKYRGQRIIDEIINKRFGV